VIPSADYNAGPDQQPEGVPTRRENVARPGEEVYENLAVGQEATRALTHLYVQAMLPTAPLWFREGFSAWSRNVAYKEGGGQRAACYGELPEGAVTFVPLNDLFTLSWDQVDDGPRIWYRDTSRVLIDYVLLGDNGKHAAHLSPLVNSIKTGAFKPPVLTELLGAPLDDLQKRLVEHFTRSKHESKAKRLCPIAFPIPDEKAADTSRKLETIPASDIQNLVNDLKRLPRRDSHPVWYPTEVVAKSFGK
jgi:hypothetical protein